MGRVAAGRAGARRRGDRYRDWARSVEARRAATGPGVKGAVPATRCARASGVSLSRPMQGCPGARGAMATPLDDVPQQGIEVPGIAPELFVGICTLLLATAVWLWVRQRRQQQRVEALVRVRTRELA